MSSPWKIKLPPQLFGQKSNTNEDSHEGGGAADNYHHHHHDDYNNNNNNNSNHQHYYYSQGSAEEQPLSPPPPPQPLPPPRASSSSWNNNNNHNPQLQPQQQPQLLATPLIVVPRTSSLQQPHIPSSPPPPRTSSSFSPPASPQQPPLRSPSPSPYPAPQVLTPQPQLQPSRRSWSPDSSAHGSSRSSLPSPPPPTPIHPPNQTAPVFLTTMQQQQQFHPAIPATAAAPLTANNPNNHMIHHTATQPFLGADPAALQVASRDTLFARNGYQLKPFDLVLFLGNDPVAKFIKNVQLNKVVPDLVRPFHNLWTHSGMLIDSSVLPLPFLVPGKLYLYESVFSGTVVGYTYSRVLPLDDHYDPKRGFHLGPQIRDFEAVVDEGESDVGICPLNPRSRQIIEDKLRREPNFFLDMYVKYKDYGYPLTILPQLAAASDGLHRDMTRLSETFAGAFSSKKEKDAAAKKKETIFCSEMVAEIYKSFALPSFINLKANEFTPLEVEVAPEFDGLVFYAKENKVKLLANGCHVPKDRKTTHFQNLVSTLLQLPNWVDVPPGGGIPPNTEPIGTDHKGRLVYIARVRIGTSIQNGMLLGAAPDGTDLSDEAAAIAEEERYANQNGGGAANAYQKIGSAFRGAMASFVPSSSSAAAAAPAEQEQQQQPQQQKGFRAGSVTNLFGGLVRGGGGPSAPATSQPATPPPPPAAAPAVDPSYPRIPYNSRSLPIKYGHTLLGSTRGLRFVPCLPGGRIPPNPLRAGVEEDPSQFLYVARVLLERQKLAGINIGWTPVQLAEGAVVDWHNLGQGRTVAVGKCGEHLGGALFAIGGREVVVRDHFDVLCFQT
ncbi:hypothetical protein DFJ73DRAFT_812883 [Zopfochytrium polystomum]|nr:hypothetical protein DFJ73DRAFT_812883 [Zopfochytrium polystomum]